MNTFWNRDIDYVVRHALKKEKKNFKNKKISQNLDFEFRKIDFFLKNSCVRPEGRKVDLRHALDRDFSYHSYGALNLDLSRKVIYIFFLGYRGVGLAPVF